MAERLYTRAEVDSELRLAEANALQSAAEECDRHAKFCKSEADNGGNRDHLMARYAEANWNAQKIRGLISASGQSLMERHDAELLVLAEKVKQTRTIWLEQHGVPISQEFANFANAIGDLLEELRAKGDAGR